jgi:hypothetical protein
MADVLQEPKAMHAMHATEAMKPRAKNTSLSRQFHLPQRQPRPARGMFLATKGLDWASIKTAMSRFHAFWWLFSGNHCAA